MRAPATAVAAAVSAAVWIAIVASPIAHAKPWRGGLELALGSYRSHSSATGRIRGGGLGVAGFVERQLPNPQWAIRAELTSEVFGNLTVRTGELEATLKDAGLLAGGLWVGASWRPRSTWVFAGAVGITRSLYFSPTSVGDSDVAPGLLVSGEWLFTAARFWRLGLVGRLTLAADSEPGGTRMSMTPMLGLRVTLGH